MSAAAKSVDNTGTAAAALIGALSQPLNAAKPAGAAPDATVTAVAATAVGSFAQALKADPKGDASYQKRIVAFQEMMQACTDAEAEGQISDQLRHDLRNRFAGLPLLVMQPFAREIIRSGGHPWYPQSDLYERLKAMLPPLVAAAPKAKAATPVVSDAKPASSTNPLHDLLYHYSDPKDLGKVAAFRTLLDACAKYEESGIDPNQGELVIRLRASIKELPNAVLIPLAKRFFKYETLHFDKCPDLFSELKLIFEPQPPGAPLPVAGAAGPAAGLIQVLGKPLDDAKAAAESDAQKRWKGVWNSSTNSYWRPALHELVYTHAFACWPETSDFRLALEASLLAKRAGLDPNKGELRQHLLERFTALSTSVKQHFIQQFDYESEKQFYFDLPNLADQLIRLVEPQLGEYRGCCDEAHKRRFASSSS